MLLQQCLPFTVLKLAEIIVLIKIVLDSCNSAYRLRYWNPIWCSSIKRIVEKLQQCLPFTVLKHSIVSPPFTTCISVATVLTVYGIETYSNDKALEAQRLEELQQCLPFTVLKLSLLKVLNRIMDVLQQCLPFTVLKLRITTSRFRTMTNCVATVLTVYGIETLLIS